MRAYKFETEGGGGTYLSSADLAGAAQELKGKYSDLISVTDKITGKCVVFQDGDFVTSRDISEC